MSTRCNIGIYNSETKKGRIIYCHFDGYYSGVGKTLQEHYTNTEKINKLLDGGDISYLGEFVEVPKNSNHSFENKNPNITCFYGRDRGETDIDAIKFEIEYDKLGKLKYNEYLYIWLEKEHKWITFH